MAKKVATKRPAAKKVSVKKTVKPAVKKWVYLFEEVGKVEKYAGSWDGVRSLRGGKGSGLADMTRAGVPVPPGFTVTT
jgi:pyruvate,orthophosphate dikinase